MLILTWAGPLELFVVGNVPINEGFLRTVFVELTLEDRSVVQRICKVIGPLGKFDMRDLCFFFLGFFEVLFNMGISLGVFVLPAQRIRPTMVLGANLRVIVHLRNIIVRRPGCQSLHHLTHLGRILMIHEISSITAAWVPRSVLRHAQVDGSVLFATELLPLHGEVNCGAGVAAAGSWVGFGASLVDRGIVPIISAILNRCGLLKLRALEQRLLEVV